MSSSEVESTHSVDMADSIRKNEIVKAPEPKTNPEKTGVDLIIDHFNQINQGFKKCIKLVSQSFDSRNALPSSELLLADQNQSQKRENIPDPDFTQTDSQEIKNKINQLATESQYRLSPEKSVALAAIDQLTKLSIKDQAFFDKLKTTIELVNSVLQAANLKLEQLSLDTQKLNDWRVQYEDLLQADYRLKKEQQISQLTILQQQKQGLSQTIAQQQRTFSGLGRLVHGRKLKANQQKYEQAYNEHRQLNSQVLEPIHDRFNEIDPVKDGLEWIDQTQANLFRSVADKVNEYYQAELIGTENLEAEPTVPLSPELIEAVNDRFIDQNVNMGMSKTKTLDPEVRQLLKEAYKVAANPSYTDQTATKTIHDLHERYKALPTEVQVQTSTLWPYYGSRPTNFNYEVLAGLALTADKRLKRELALNNLTERMRQLLQAKTSGEQSLDVQYALLTQLTSLEEEAKKSRESVLSIDQKRARCFLDTPEVQVYFEQGQLNALERYLSRSLVDQLLTVNYLHNRLDQSQSFHFRDFRTVELQIQNLGEDLLQHTSPEAMPVVFMQAYRRVNGEHRLLQRSWPQTPIQDYAEQITPADLAKLNEISPNLASLIGQLKELMRQNPEFNYQKIVNPEIQRYQELLKKDPEFIEYCSQQLYGDRSILITDDESWARINPETDNLELPATYLNQQLGQQFDVGTLFLPNDDRNKTIKQKLISLLLEPKKIKPYFGTKLEFKIAQNYQSVEQLCLVPEAEITRSLTRLGFTENPFDQFAIENPTYRKIEENLVKLAVEFLNSQDLKQIKFALPLLERINSELSAEAYQALGLIVTDYKDSLISKEVVNCLLTRSSEGDGQAPAILMGNYEQLSQSARQQLQLDAPIAFRAMVEMSDPSIINERSIACFADLLRISASEAQMTLDLFKSIRAIQDNFISAYEIKETWSGCMELAKRAEAIQLVEFLIKESGYRFNLAHAPILCQVIDDGRVAEFMASVRVIRQYIPEYIYEIVYYGGDSKIDSAIYQPFEVLFRYNQTEKLKSLEKNGFLENILDETSASMAINQSAFEFIRSFYQELTRLTDQEISPGLVNEFGNNLVKIINLTKSDVDVNFINFLFKTPVLRLIASQPNQIDKLLELEHTDFFKSEYLNRLLLKNLDNFINIRIEKITPFLEVMVAIESSPSQELQRIKREILDQVMRSEDPLEAYRKISDIFIKNNLPLVGKLMSIFTVLNPPDYLDGNLRSNDHLSPTLRHSSERARYWTIYRDLLSIHVRSGNRSLRDYMEVIESGQTLLNKVENNSLEDLSSEELQQLNYLVAHINTLLQNSALVPEAPQGIEANKVGNLDRGEILATITQLRSSLRVATGQSLSDRIAQMFLRPIGLQDFDQLRQTMREAKEGADQRSRALIRQTADGLLTLEAGDMLKGVGIQYIANIIQNGSVAKEYLGASADSDATPYDTDVGRLLPKDISTDSTTGESQLSRVIEATPARDYGNLLLVFKDRGQFQLTGRDDRAEFIPGKYELFNTQVLDSERHYGIRTGIATTEIDFMIWRESSSSTELKQICFEIAQNGFYIPIVDKDGKVLFSPSMYDRLREIFRGVARFDGESLPFTPTEPSDPNYEMIKDILEEKSQDREAVDRIKIKIHNIVKEVLSKLNIKLKDKFDRSIVGAELIDTGSTSRYTNKPNDYDFDLMLKLDDADMVHASTIVERLKEIFDPAQAQYFASEERGHLLRLFGAKGVHSEPTDIDVSLSRKSELAVYGSHQAIADKLESLAKVYGEEARAQTVANIVLCKQILTEGKCYKKGEEGGMGGIGVENWILANDGNMLKAFESFWRAANSTGERARFNDFTLSYRLDDAGLNIRESKRDNFIVNMNPSGYEATLNTIERYWQEHGLELPVIQH